MRKGSWESVNVRAETVADVPAASICASRWAGSAVNSGCVSSETMESNAVSTRQVAARIRVGRVFMVASGGWWMPPRLGTADLAAHRLRVAGHVSGSRLGCQLQTD